MDNKDFNFEQYSLELNKSLKNIDRLQLENLEKKLSIAIKESKKIIIMGNGGSAANAIHIAGDYMKTFSLLGLRPKISTPCDNLCFLTAASNDIDYSDSFRIYLDSVIEEDTIIIFLSGSGNSINLIKCCNSKNIKSYKNCNSWSITGFKGGKISKLTDYFIHIPTLNMEIAEDIQLIIFHFIKQRIHNEVINDKTLKKNVASEKYYKRTILNEVS